MMTAINLSFFRFVSKRLKIGKKSWIFLFLFSFFVAGFVCFAVREYF